MKKYFTHVNILFNFKICQSSNDYMTYLHPYLVSFITETLIMIRCCSCILTFGKIKIVKLYMKHYGSFFFLKNKFNWLQKKNSNKLLDLKNNEY